MNPWKHECGEGNSTLTSSVEVGAVVLGFLFKQWECAAGTAGMGNDPTSPLISLSKRLENSPKLPVQQHKKTSSETWYLWQLWKTGKKNEWRPPEDIFLSLKQFTYFSIFTVFFFFWSPGIVCEFRVIRALSSARQTLLQSDFYDDSMKFLECTGELWDYC